MHQLFEVAGPSSSLWSVLAFLPYSLKLASNCNTASAPCHAHPRNAINHVPRSHPSRRGKRRRPGANCYRGRPRHGIVCGVSSGLLPDCRRATPAAAHPLATNSYCSWCSPPFCRRAQVHSANGDVTNLTDSISGATATTLFNEHEAKLVSERARVFLDLPQFLSVVVPRANAHAWQRAGDAAAGGHRAVVALLLAAVTRFAHKHAGCSWQHEHTDDLTTRTVCGLLRQGRRRAPLRGRCDRPHEATCGGRRGADVFHRRVRQGKSPFAGNAHQPHTSRTPSCTTRTTTQCLSTVARRLGGATLAPSFDCLSRWCGLARPVCLVSGSALFFALPPAPPVC